MMEEFKQNDFFILEVLARADTPLEPSQICKRVETLPIKFKAKKLARSSFYYSLNRLMPKYAKKVPQRTFPRKVKYVITRAGQELLKLLEANFLFQEIKLPETFKDQFIFSYAKPREGKIDVMSIRFPEHLQHDLNKIFATEKDGEEKVGEFIRKSLEFFLTRKSKTHSPLTFEMVKLYDNMILLKQSMFEYCSVDEIAHALRGSNFEERLFVREFAKMLDEKLKKGKIKKGLKYFFDEAANIVARLLDFDYTSLPEAGEIKDDSVKIYRTIAARTYLKPLLRAICDKEKEGGPTLIRQIAENLGVNVNKVINRIKLINEISMQHTGQVVVKTRMQKPFLTFFGKKVCKRLLVTKETRFSPPLGEVQE